MEIKYLYILFFFYFTNPWTDTVPTVWAASSSGVSKRGEEDEENQYPQPWNQSALICVFTAQKIYNIERERERERGVCRLRLLLFLCPKKTPRRFVVLLFFRNFSPHRETRRALPKLSRPDRFLPHHFSCPTTTSSKECLSLFLVSNSSQSDCQHSNIFPV